MTDGIEKANFVFIGRPAEYLLNYTAEDLMAQPKIDEDEFLPTKFLDLHGKKYIFTVHSGNNKFRSNMITNQVTNVTPIPPTIGAKHPTPSSTKTASPHPPATPAENYEKNRYETLNQNFFFL